MINPTKIEEMAKQISELIPPGVKSAGDEVERKVKQVIQSKLNQMDVVNREDFDVQTQVLLRTRIKLEDLEKKVAALEAKLGAAQLED